ncbi:MAG: thiamine pyrophosphate-binding protein [SAR324 cluster bacterium]|jgi:acetolactate synthase-1/2/3 large subunit|nr:thiamine pyrophosphate-binding protein [SAR324 cluster bacterium]
MIKGNQIIAEAIRDVGIETVFTVAGGHFLPTYNEIGILGETTIVTARHEQGAGYMASGYALATGRVGVVFSGAPGPGATNLVTSVANAQADSIPLLVLTAQVDKRYLHRNILQYCDNVVLFEPFCKRSIQAASLDEIPNLLATSIQLALSGRPGPVHIALPQNLQAERSLYKKIIPFDQLKPGEPTESDINKLLEKLSSCQRPAILSGHGVMRAGASKVLQEVAEKLGAPVATSRSGIGSLPTSHPQSVGMLGFYGTETARESISEADLILVLGCALGEQTTFGWRSEIFEKDALILQVDVDVSQLNRVYKLDQGIAFDVGAVLNKLSANLAKRNSWFHRRPKKIQPQNDPVRGISAATFIQVLNSYLPDDAIVSADIGNHRLWVCDQLNVTRPEGLLQSCEFDAMGFSLPAAIGASIALPGTKIISISGDGGFVHTFGELSVAKEKGLPVVGIVFVDGALGILRHQAEEMYGKDYFTRLAKIDFAKFADALDIESRKVKNDKDLDQSIAWAINSSNPVLLSVAIDPNEVFPPLRTKIEQRRRDLMGEA